MRGSRRGCVRLRVRFSGQILLTSVTNQYKLYSLCICSFALVLHKSTFYPTITIFNNVNDMSKLWRLIQTQWCFCFAEAISQCTVNVVSGDLQTCVLHWSTIIFPMKAGVFRLNEPLDGSTSAHFCFGVYAIVKEEMIIIELHLIFPHCHWHMCCLPWLSSLWQHWNSSPDCCLSVPLILCCYPTIYKVTQRQQWPKRW